MQVNPGSADPVWIICRRSDLFKFLGLPNMGLLDWARTPREAHIGRREAPPAIRLFDLLPMHRVLVALRYLIELMKPLSRTGYIWVSCIGTCLLRHTAGIYIYSAILETSDYGTIRYLEKSPTLPHHL